MESITSKRVRIHGTLGAIGLALIISSGMANAQGQPAEPNQQLEASSTQSDAEDLGWPRKFAADGHDILVYQPQVDEWFEFDRVTFRSVISIASADTPQPTFGVIRMSADTKVALEERIVVLTNRKLEELTFPDLEPSESNRLVALVMKAIPPEKPQTISLDRLIAGLDISQITVRTVDVNVQPPKIYYSDTPAIMMSFMGKPRFKQVPDSDLLFAINTNWDVFLEPSSKEYFLLNGDTWIRSADIENGPWMPVQSLPAAFAALPDDGNWSDVKAAIPGVQAVDIPRVLVTHEPSELVVTEGSPELEIFSGINIAAVVNTENDLFYDTANKQYYLLTAGRWFRTDDLAGKWSTASTDLPDDFLRLPSETETDVLAAVPGTQEASDAVILASIPHKATINKQEVSIDVVYNGEPDFRPIEKTSILYAYNSPMDVFKVEDRYYALYNAVWFVSNSPAGPWVVADSVPDAIYSIPPTSPKHNVTYVNIYESTPTTVTTGYTSGYTGTAIAPNGVVMFGLGLLVADALDDDDDCCWSYHYSPAFYSYGTGAVWRGTYGGYAASTRYYGPYGGAGRAAVYNPATGFYSRGAYAYGPNRAAGYRAAYNPATGISAGRAAGSTPYGSWGRSAVTNGDEWIRAGHTTTARGTVGGIQTSEGGAMITAQGRFGNGSTVARSESGDYYAARDGNVYKKDESGWQQTRNTPNSTRQTPTQTRANPQQAERPAQPGLPDDLQRQHEARERGDQASARTREARRSPQSSPSRSRSSGGGGRRR